MAARGVGGNGRRASRRSRAAPVRFVADRFEPPDRVDQRAPVAVPRRGVALQNLGDGFKRARGLGFGAHEPHLQALDHGIKRAPISGRPRLPRGRLAPRDAIEPSGGRIEAIVDRLVGVRTAVRVHSRVVGDGLVKPIVKAHAGAAGGLDRGVPGPPAHARDIPRHGSIHVLDHRSGAANRPWNRRRRGPSTLSGLMVKKRLKRLPRRLCRGPPQSCMNGCGNYQLHFPSVSA